MKRPGLLSSFNATISSGHLPTSRASSSTQEP